MGKKKLKHLCSFLFVCLVIVGCASDKNNRISIYVAAGLNPVITAIKTNVEYADLISNAASSGTLARQIKAGAQADVYFSANYKWVDYLLQIDLIDSSNIETIASNKLVVIVPSGKPCTKLDEDSVLSFFNSADVIAIGNPEYVPVGDYTQKYLQNIRSYEKLSSKFLKAKDVMSTLKLVEMGEADCGFVYKTAALQSKKVDIVYTVPDTLCEPIYFYSVAITDAGSKLLSDKHFNELFKSELANAGFETP